MVLVTVFKTFNGKKMKKILFSIVLSLAVFQYANAQLIELEGTGVLDQSSATIYFSDLASIDHVVVEATAIVKNGDPNVEPAEYVTFSDADETYDAGFNYVKTHYSVASFDPSYAGNHKGYYTATFNTVDANGITLDKNELGDQVMAYYVYIYRKDVSYTSYSMVNQDEVPAFLHAMGPDYPVVGEFDLMPATGNRDVTVMVPLSDNETLDEDERIGVVTFYANGMPMMYETVTFELNYGEKNFHIEELTLNNVPQEVDKVTVEVYSPSPQGTGDSFFAGTFVLTVTDYGCTLTQGYWKTHSEYGPAPYDDTWAMLEDGADTEFYDTGMTWYEVFQTPVKGNAYYQLAHQYMAAYLNMLNGAWLPEDVQNALDWAEETLFSDYDPDDLNGKGKNANKALQTDFKQLAELLDEYNNGIIGPGHCDEMETDDVEQEEEYEAQAKGKSKGKNKSAQIEKGITAISDLMVYPNPVLNSATISFMPVSDGNASIDLYNSIGQKISRLFERNVSRDVPVNIQFNSSDYKEGLYILRVQNGNDVATTRVQIAR